MYNCILILVFRILLSFLKVYRDKWQLERTFNYLLRFHILGYKGLLSFPFQCHFPVPILLTVAHLEFKLNPIACLSGLDYTVFATSDEKTVASLSLRCRLVQVVLVPVQWPFDEEIVSSDLDEDLRLGWSSPACGKCESRGEQCGFRSYSSLQVGCLGDPKHGIPRTARYAISAGAGLILMFAVGLLCFLCGRIHSAYNHHGPSPLTDPEIVLQPIAVSGLDEPTIESFPKVVLGQSLRLPKPDSDTCPICLSEYMPKETLRSIPQCQHCFHADCIDEWLRLNPTCPVCRNLPEQAFPNEHLIL